MLFRSQIIARLGYGTVKTNLYTVAPNCTGAVMLLILAYSSDYTRWRFPFIALGFFFTFCGFIIYAAIDVEANIHVAYFACFMMVSTGCRVQAILKMRGFSLTLSNSDVGNISALRNSRRVV